MAPNLPAAHALAVDAPAAAAPVPATAQNDPKGQRTLAEAPAVAKEPAGAAIGVLVLAGLGAKNKNTSLE